MATIAQQAKKTTPKLPEKKEAGMFDQQPSLGGKTTGAVQLDMDDTMKVADGGSTEGVTTDTIDTDESVPWINFLDAVTAEDKAVLYQKLSDLQMTVSRGMRTKDFTRDYRNKTVYISPVSFEDVQSELLLSVTSKCFFINYRFQKERELNGREQFGGTVDLMFRRETDLKEQLSMLKGLKEGISVFWLKELTPKKYRHKAPAPEATAAAGKEEATMFDAVQAPTEEVKEPTGQLDEEEDKETENTPLQGGLSLFERDVDDIPYDPNLTLYSSTMTGKVTDDQMWELFPLASRIILLKDPFLHVYIIFNKEELLQKNVNDLINQTPCLKPFQITRLSHAGEAFRQISVIQRRHRNVASKKNKRGAGSGGGTNGQNQFTASIPPQQVLAPPAQVNAGALGGLGQAGLGGQVTGLLAAMGGSPVPDSNPSSDNPNASPQKLSKNQQRKQKKFEAKRRAQEQAQSQQGAAPLLSNTPTPQPSMNAGIALLQTLTNLAANMAQTNQMGGMQQNSPGNWQGQNQGQGWSGGPNPAEKRQWQGNVDPNTNAAPSNKRKKNNRRNKKKSQAQAANSGNSGDSAASMLKPAYGGTGTTTTTPSYSTESNNPNQATDWSSNYTSFEQPSTQNPASTPQTNYGSYGNQGSTTGQYGY